jgi:hypothetical protein
MKLFKSLLLASTCLLSSLNASAAARAEPQVGEEAYVAPASKQGVYTMGFKVETSGIKVQHDNEDEILVILESLNGKWQLTTDTQDKSIDSTKWVNLECRTVSGLTQAEINKLAYTTYKLISEIKAMCDLASDGRWSINFKKLTHYGGIP